MKLLNRRVFLLTIGIFLLIFLSGCGGGGGEREMVDSQGNGELSMKIFSPYGYLLDEQIDTYYDGETKNPSKSIVISRYKDYGENYQGTEAGFAKKPFCRIGGTYRVEVKNKNMFGTELRKSVLYYCKTIEDLLKQVKVPNSWRNSNLTLYCNDGNQINFESLNLDFLTTKFNKYKICIVKNEDFGKENTILYGYEVGNKIIDSYKENLFDVKSKSFAFDVNNKIELTKMNQIDGLSINLKKYVMVPYVRWPSGCTVSEGGISFLNGNFNTRAHLIYTKGKAPGPGTICYRLKKRSFSYIDNNGVRGTKEAYACESYSCDYITPRIRAKYPNANLSTRKEYSDVPIKSNYNGDYVTINFNGEDLFGFTWYEVMVPINYSIASYKFNLTGKTLYFDYDESNTFFVVKNTPEELKVPINSIFSSAPNLGLSRVAFFRKLGENFAYGYEKAAKYVNPSFEEETFAIYKIEFDGFNMDQDSCVSNLASYGARSLNSISSSNTISCSTGGNININSKTIDAEYGAGTGFTIFKNIILNLK